MSYLNDRVLDLGLNVPDTDLLTGEPGRAPRPTVSWRPGSEQEGNMPRSIRELINRRTLCDFCIRQLLQPEMQADPRQKDALAHYQAQLKKIDAELTEARRLDRQARGLPEPEPVVVGLKPARLFGKADRN